MHSKKSIKQLYSLKYLHVYITAVERLRTATTPELQQLCKHQCFYSFLNVEEQWNLVAFLYPHFIPLDPKSLEYTWSLFSVNLWKTNLQFSGVLFVFLFFLTKNSVFSLNQYTIWKIFFFLIQQNTNNGAVELTLVGGRGGGSRGQDIKNVEFHAYILHVYLLQVIFYM